MATLAENHFQPLRSSPRFRVAALFTYHKNPEKNHMSQSQLEQPLAGSPRSQYSAELATLLNLGRSQIERSLQLLDEGATIPFIARYRKEMTGSLDEVQLTSIRDKRLELTAIDKRRLAILDGMKERNQLTPGLQTQLAAARSLTELEDIYLPFRPKRQTRAAIARSKGLGPLADAIWKNPKQHVAVDAFLAPDKDISSKTEIYSGVQDILAEMIAEQRENRSALRKLFLEEAVISTKPVTKNLDKAEKYRDYFSWQEPAAKAPSHRLLAILRGEREKCLSVTIRPDEERGQQILKRRHLVDGPWRELLATTIQDSYRRLLAPSLENELRHELKSRADCEAIEVFATNLRQLLLAAPLGAKRVLAIDPGYRTGGKVVCLDAQGQLLESVTIFPTHGGHKLSEAEEIVNRLVRRHAIEAIAIGNGTAGRETEQFVRNLSLPEQVIIAMVNEDGASIYSASESARTEFPDLDLTVRGAISIGRRLQDPLAELVKIEPKSIGVGQYQHDVDQQALERSLQEVTASCVNSVGVELNTASSELLTHVSGLGPVLAANIIDYRNASGPFTSRSELLKVPRLGAKTFEQCAGFLRIRDSKHPLDGSGVHPERYGLVATMASDLQVSIQQLMQSETLRRKIPLNRYTDSSVGMATLNDIMAELAKPGRDPRQRFQHFRFADEVQSIDDLAENMELPAVITNITKFGAFASIGIKQDGLIHISEMADRFIKDPGEIVHLGQQVLVRVIQIDKERGRIGLSLRRQKS